MSKGGYTIRRLEMADCDLLVPLMKDSFGVTVAPGYFKWKYFNNPAGNCVGFIAIEKNSNIGVSFYGAIPQKYIVDGKERILYQACDTMTHTAHRKKGLYPVLARECYDLLKSSNEFFLIGIGGSPQSLPVLEHFGWKILFRFRNYFKPAIFCRSYVLKKYSINKFNTEDSLESLKELILNKKSEAGIYSPGDPLHYQWRVRNPNYKYQAISYRDKGIIQGYVVFYENNNKIFLFDFNFAKPGSRKALLWYLSRWVIKNKHKGIVSFCKENDSQSRELKKSMFISNPFRKGPLTEKPPFLILSDEQTMEKYSNAGLWHITAYDYDAS